MMHHDDKDDKVAKANELNLEWRRFLEVNMVHYDDKDYWDKVALASGLNPEWHRFFAWYPCMTEKGYRWLCYVQRRWFHDNGITPIEYHYWEYREDNH